MKKFHLFLQKTAAVLSIAALGLPAALPAHAAEALTEETLLEKKCSLCHSAKRMFEISKSEIKAVLERMQKKNPDWLSDIESKHIAEQLEKILGSDDASAAAAAQKAAVASGKKIFENASLGTSGESCADCHTPQSLRLITAEYPRYDKGTGRMVSLPEKINLMITGQMKGKALPLTSEEMVQLMSYIKTLR